MADRTLSSTSCVFGVLAALGVLIVAGAAAQAPNKYDAFRDEFRNKASQSLGQEVLRTWDTTSVYLSNSFVAATLGDALAQARVRASGDFPRQTLNAGVEKPFEVNIKCPDPCPSCNQGWPPARWACQAATLPCRIAFAAAIGPCYLAMAITGGNATGAVAIENVRAGATLTETRISPSVSADLSSLALGGPLVFVGSAGADGRLKMTGDLRLITMCYTTKVPLGDHNITAIPSLPLRATLTTTAGDGYLDVKIAPQAIPVTLGFEVSPFFQIGFSLLFAGATCPFAAPALTAAAAVSTLGGVYDSAVGIRYQFSLTPDSITVHLADAVAEKPDGSSIRLSARHTTSAISFVARSNP